jgi:predicted glycoside hydrolase/deacetylase ChbG (UPF0249 family)
MGGRVENSFASLARLRNPYQTDLNVLECQFMKQTGPSLVASYTFPGASFLNNHETRFNLIVNADDFGPNADVSKAILDAFTNGVVTSTSVIINMRAAEPWINELAKRSLPAGIHLNIFSGQPVSPLSQVRSLVDDTGQFRRFSSISEMETQIDTAELLIEFRSQTAKLKYFGISPTHIDVHRHEIYFCPRLFAVVAELAQEMLLPLRMPLECNLERYGKALASLAGWSTDDLKELQTKIRTICNTKSIKHPTSFVPDLMLNEKVSRETLFESLTLVPSGVTEICTHPSYASERGLYELHILKQLQAAITELKIKFEPASFKNV